MTTTSLGPFRCDASDKARWDMAVTLSGEPSMSDYLRRCLDALAAAVDAQLPEGRKLDDLLAMSVDVDEAIRKAQESL